MVDSYLIRDGQKFIFIEDGSELKGLLFKKDDMDDDDDDFEDDENDIDDDMDIDNDDEDDFEDMSDE